MLLMLLLLLLFGASVGVELYLAPQNCIKNHLHRMHPVFNARLLVVLLSNAVLLSLLLLLLTNIPANFLDLKNAIRASISVLDNPNCNRLQANEKVLRSKMPV